MASFATLEKETLFFQRLLKFAGFYADGKLDGIDGPMTQAAREDWLTSHAQVADRIGRFSDRTEGHLLTVLPAFALEVRRMLAALRVEGDNWELTGGLRTYAEQKALYAQGRTTPGKIVTKASAGQSYHNFGIAVDLVLIRGKEALYAEKYYKIVGVEASRVGLVWGGNFKSIKDTPHVQLGNFTVSYLCGYFERGIMTMEKIIRLNS